MNGEVLIKFKGDTTDVDKKTAQLEGSFGKLTKSITMGNLAAKGIGTAMQIVSQNMDKAINRIDTMNNFPKVMKNFGVSTDEANKSIKRIDKTVQGLPTSLDQAVAGVQDLFMVTKDLKESEKLFKAVNDSAMVFANGSTEAVDRFIYGFKQALSAGKVSAQDFNQMNEAIPGLMSKVAEAMGITFKELKDGLSDGSISIERFNETLNILDTQGVGTMKSLEKSAHTATGGIKTSIANMKTAFARGIANIINSIDKSLKSIGGLSGAIGKVGKIVEGLFKSISSIIPAITKIVINLIKTLKTLLPLIKTIVTAWLAYKATLIAIQAINIVSTIAKTASAFITLIPSIHSAKNAMDLLNMTFKSNPIGIVIASITALVAAFKFLYNEFTKDLRALDEEVEKSVAEVDEFTNSYKEAQKTRDETINQSMSELDYYQNLWNELKNITDANGKVNEGYQERAQFIVTTLNEALGTEITMTDGIIQNYGELNTAIDEHIKKMKAEAIITAQKDVYVEAMQKRQQAVEQLNKANDERKRQQAILNQLEEKWGNSWLKISGPVHQEIDKQIKKQKERVNETKKSYKEMEDTVNGYYNDIQESEAMFTDYEQGNYDKLTNIHYDYQANIQGDEKAQKESLKNQIDSAKLYLDTLIQLKNKYHTDVYDADIQSTQDQIKAMEDRYAVLDGTAKTGEEAIQRDVLESMNKQVATIKGKKYEFMDAGNGNVQLYVEGVKKGEPIAINKAEKLVENANKKMKDGKKGAKEAGEYLVDGVTKGINSKDKQSSAFSAVSFFAGGLLDTLRRKLKIGSPSKVTRQYGEWMLEGFGLGINDEKKTLLNNIGNLGDNIVGKMGGSLAKAMPQLSSNFDLSPQMTGSMQNSFSPNVNVYNNINVEQDPLGQMVRTIKTYSGGSPNDYNYGAGA